MVTLLASSCSAGLKATVEGKPNAANSAINPGHAIDPQRGPAPGAPAIEGTTPADAITATTPPWLVDAPEDLIGEVSLLDDLPLIGDSQPTLSFNSASVDGTGKYRIELVPLDLSVSLTTQIQELSRIFEVELGAHERRAFKLPTPLADGKWRALISEKNPDGTYSEPQSTSFEVDAEEPGAFDFDPVVSGRRSGQDILISWGMSLGSSQFQAALFPGGGASSCTGSPVRRARGTNRSWTLSGLPEGTYRVCVFAGDRSGRLVPATQQEVVFVVDRTPPSLTIAPTATQRLRARDWPVTFDVVFSEAPALISLAADDFTQDGSATGIVWEIHSTADPSVFHLKAVSGSSTEGLTILPKIGAGRFTDLTGISNHAGAVASQAVFFDQTPPQAPTSFVATGSDGEAVLTWIKGSDASGTVIVRRKDVAVAWIPASGSDYSVGSISSMGEQIVYVGTGLTETVDSLANEAPYHFAAFAVDEAGNYSNAAVTTVTPSKPGAWLVGGSVADMVEHGGKLYLGGQFQQIGPATGSGVVVSRDHLTPECESSLRISGSVMTSIPDGVGGWFVAGEFETVNGIPRRNLIRINSHCDLHPFDARVVGGVVKALVRDGSRLFAGGAFTGIGGVAQPFLAALDPDTGAVVGFNGAGPTHSVEALAIHAGRLIVSGSSYFNGIPLGGAAIFRSDTGAPYCPNPKTILTNGAVLAAAPDGAGGWFIGGQFTAIGTFERRSLAHIDSSCQVTSWQADATSVYQMTAAVKGLFLNSGRLYLWGDFTHVGGTVRKGLAAIDATTAVLHSWDPSPSSIVYTMDASTDQVFIGGQFKTIGGQARECIASFNKNDLSISAWQPTIRSGAFCAKVWDLDVEGNLVYLAGQFSTVNSVTRNSFAVVNKDTGALDALNVTLTPTSINHYLKSIEVHDGKIYISGLFDFVNGTGRPGWAMLNASDGSLVAVNPAFDASMSGFVSDGSASYYWGNFTTAVGQSRHHLAKINEAAGTLDSWDSAVVSGSTGFIKLSGSQVFAGGYIHAVSSPETSPRKVISLYNLTTYQPDPLDIDCDGATPTLVVYDDTLFTGGEELGCTTNDSRFGLFGVDLNTGVVDESYPVITSGWINAAVVQGGRLFVGGEFSDLGGQVRYGAGALDLTSKQVTSWDPLLNSANNDTVYSIAVDDENHIWLGGSISKSNGQVRANLAIVDSLTGGAVIGDATPPAGGRVKSIVPAGRAVFIGGEFGTFGGVARSNLAAIDLATGRPDSWRPDPDHVISAMAVYGDKLYTGGSFSTIAGAARDKLAAFDLPGQTINAWNPGPIATGGPGVAIYDMVANSNGVFAVGMFGTVNGTARVNMAAFALNDGTLLSWAPATNAFAPVHYIEDTGTDLVIAGNFGAVNGTTRSGIAKVNYSTGALISGWNPGGGLHTYNASFLVSGSDLIVGRNSSTTIGGQARGSMAILDLTAGTALPFNPAPTGYVSGLWADGSNVLAAGRYEEIGGVYRSGFALLDRTSGAATSWQTPLNGNPTKVLKSGAKFYIGCASCQANDHILGGFIVLDAATGAISP